MKVINCNSLKEIVSEQGSEAEEEEGREKKENASKLRIVFRQLKVLELVSLNSLESFCRSKCCAFEFPSLEKFVVNACSKLENFTEKDESAIVLQKVYTVLHEKENGCRWKGNLQATIQHIFQEKKFFEGMVELSVSDHPELEEVWQRKEGPLKDWFYSLKTLKLKGCKFEKYAIPSNVLGRLKSLQELEVCNCSNITFIFEMNDIKIRKTPLGLKNLTLQGLPDVTHVWQQEQKNKKGILGFKCLQQVSVCRCRELQTLLPTALARYLKMLEKLEVESCKELPQIIGNKEEAADGTVVFPRLTSLMLTWLPKLTCLYSERFLVECPKLDYLYVKNCDNLDTKKIFEGVDELAKDGLPKVSFNSLKTLRLWQCKFETCALPSNILLCLKSLQELEVDLCSNMTFIFEMNDPKIGETTLPLKKLTVSTPANLTHVWQQEEHEQGILSFKNLQQVSVSFCSNLKTLFPTALAGYLEMLEKLEVRNCGKLPQIVGKEEEAGDGTGNVCVFPRLTSLVLLWLPMLTCFYSHSLPKAHSPAMECPQLDYFDVRGCPKLELFHSDRKDQGCSLFSDIKGISKVEKLFLSWKDAKVRLGQSKDQCLQYLSELELHLGDYENENFTLPFAILEKAPNLEKMDLTACVRLEKISAEGMLGHLKRLELYHLQRLQSIQVLEHLPKLQELRVSHSPLLTALVQPSAAKMSMDLEEIYVRDCKSMMEIVGKGQDEIAVEEIKFERLEMISLIDLSGLECFYSGNATLQLPSLIQVNITRCPKVESFCQGSSHVEKPASRLIQVCYDRLDETESVLHHDLNVVVRWLPVIKQDRLVLADDPALKGIWLREVEIPFDSLFRNLNSLVVEGCEFLSNAILPSHLLPFLSNLRMLKVRNCDSVKTIFDVKDLQNQPQGRISLPGLQEVIVSGCKSIESLFPASFAKDNLQKLDVRNCAELAEIVAKDDEIATEEASKKVAVFPKVTSLTLWNLPKLRCIYSGVDILDWPMLQGLDVYHCQMLKIFATEFQNSPDLYPEDQDHFTTDKHGIISADKVPPNLEGLSLSKEEFILIERGLVHVDLQKLKFLRLHGFFNNDSDALLPDAFFSKMPLTNIQEFRVAESSFKEIFPSQTPGVDFTTKSFSQLKKLELRSLQRLESIGLEHSRLPPLVENLQNLKVLACSCLTHLVPSTVSFSRLTKLDVMHCAKLKYLFTSSTARGLVVLSEMSIINCELLETVIVVDDEEGDKKDKDMVFSRLSRLSLKKLPKLENFYPGNSTLKFRNSGKPIFGLLNLITAKSRLEFENSMKGNWGFSVEITQCKSMKTFSHGDVEVSQPRKLEIDGAKWDDVDLNSAVRQQFEKATKQP